MREPRELPVSLDGVSLRIGAVEILRDIELRIAAGPPTAIIGPNGSGKSTLLRVLMGLIEPTEGAVVRPPPVAGEPHRRAMLFQKPVLLRRSAAANIDYALARAGCPRAMRRKRIDDLLARVGLAALAARPARRLSGGEQQKLALARALARDPQLLLLDEPTASLDPAATHAVEDIIRDAAASGVKIVIVSHDLAQTRRLAADVNLLIGGRLRESGPVENFFNTPQTPQARAFLRGDIVTET